MARKAQILCHVKDYNGATHAVHEMRPTEHGFSICIGWPIALKRGQGAGGPKVILTAPLADHLEATKLTPGKHGLPIGRTVVKRLRAELELNWHRDRAEWWEENPDGPGAKDSTRSMNRKKMGLKSNNYWSAEEDQQLIALHRQGLLPAACGKILQRPARGVSMRLWRLRSKGLLDG